MNWVWHATPKQLLSGPKREQKAVAKDLPKGAFYIEVWADKTPTLHYEEEVSIFFLNL